MTNNPTIDGVSRETVQNAIEALTRHLAGHAPMQVPPSKSDSDLVREELRALLDARVVERQPVEFDYPEFHTQGMGCGLEDRGITDRYEAMRYGFDEALDQFSVILESIGPLYTAPPAPVAVVLPERMDGEPYWSQELDPDFDQRLEWAEEKGWNACLDATAALNGGSHGKD